jgi:poly-gamma-glutamate synthesis protein (capsule biosynthesis protein)
MNKTAALLACAILISGCAVVAPTPTPTPTPTPKPTATATPLPPTPTPTPAPLRVWLSPAVPLVVRDAVREALTELDTLPAASAEGADLRVDLGLPVTLAQWVYAVVVPFPMLLDEVHWQDIVRFWHGEPEALAGLAEPDKPPTLFVDPETLGVLHGLLGPSSERAPITVVEEEDLVADAWGERPHAWAVVPFDALKPRWKVLAIDGADVLDKQLAVPQYPLTVSIGAEGRGAETLAQALLGEGDALTNRDTEQMTVLVMTGVTALVRGIAARMERHGILHPALYVGDVLRQADLAHISNEIPFAENCPPPDPSDQSLVFCSDPRYIELLRHVGADLIELTGNHFQDYGSAATLHTLKMYEEEGWPHYGGGADLDDARQAIVMESNGNKLSFIGCNPVGPEFAWATENSPGAAPCDFTYMHSEIERLSTEVDVPIATWQYWEFYQYEPTDQQRYDFRGMVDAGAVIVSGSQAHHPQAIEFYKDGFIHYGLGNLFFDQMWSLGTRQEMIDRHIIYGGRHISTQLLTFMLEDYSQPRPMTAEERQQLLSAVFEASGW